MFDFFFGLFGNPFDGRPEPGDLLTLAVFKRLADRRAEEQARQDRWAGSGRFDDYDDYEPYSSYDEDDGRDPRIADRW